MSNMRHVSICALYVGLVAEILRLIDASVLRDFDEARHIIHEVLGPARLRTSTYRARLQNTAILPSTV
jgi:hypothetical protein